MDVYWEQKWLANMHSHPWKQEAFIGRDVREYSSRLRLRLASQIRPQITSFQLCGDTS